MKKALDLILRTLGAITLGFLLIWLFNSIHAQTFAPATQPLEIKNPIGKFFDGYKVKPGKMVAWAGYAAAGAWHGMREAYHADNFVFEKKFGVDPYSFWGSQAWQRNYEGNRYQTADGGINEHKPEYLNTFRDVWHFSNQNHNLLLVGCTFGLATGKQKWQHKALDVLIGMGVRSVTAWATYNWLRS